MKAVWFNGRLAEGQIALDPQDRGLTLGDGLFETFLVVNRTALWRHMHMARMEASAGELGLPFEHAAIDAAIDGLLAGAGTGHHALRLEITRGAAARGLAGSGTAATILATLDSLDPALMFQEASLATSSLRRSPQSVATRMKTLSYIDNIAAAREAASHGADDALLLNTAGKIACTTIANLFLVRKGKLITPARGQAILTGVTRQALIAAAQHAGFVTEERAVTLADLARAEGVFLTNSLRFIRPVSALDRKPLPQADLTPFADALCNVARLQCGRDPRLI